MFRSNVSSKFLFVGKVLEKVSQLTVKKCILNSAPKSCELDPIPSKLLIECLDSILPSLTDLFNSSLVNNWCSG